MAVERGGLKYEILKEILKKRLFLFFIKFIVVWYNFGAYLKTSADFDLFQNKGVGAFDKKLWGKPP